jgi:hypothetical protein
MRGATKDGRRSTAAPRAIPTLLCLRGSCARDPRPSRTQKQLIADLGRLDLRQRAGAEEHRRNRRGHDLRRTFITLARADGAADSWLRWITHGPASKRDARRLQHAAAGGAVRRDG